MFSRLKKVYQNNGYLIASVFASSVFISLLFLLFLKNIGPAEHRIPGTDYLTIYEPLADNMLREEGFVINGKMPLSHIPPGFPLILSFIFALSQAAEIGRPALIIIFNVIFAAFSSLFIFLLTKEIFNKKIALIASLLWMTYPFNLWFLKNPNTEVPFISFLYLFLFLYVFSLKKQNLKIIFWAGFALGLAILIRLTGLFIPVLAVLFIFYFLNRIDFRKQIMFILIFLAGASLVLFPWFLYLFSNTGSFLPVSTLGQRGFVIGFTLLTVSGYEKLNFSEQTVALLQRLKEAEKSGPNAEGAMPVLLKEFRSHPGIMLNLIMIKMMRSWYATYMMWWEGLILSLQIFYLITAVFGAFYLLKNKKDSRKYLFFFLSVIFYFWGITTVSNSILRYMMPVMGLMMIFSAIAIDKLLTKYNFYAKIGFGNNFMQK